jgi:hypothetical protein
MPTLQGSAPKTNCRVWPRHECELAGACAPLASHTEGAPAWTAKVRDLSRIGVGLVLTRRFEVGTVLSLELDAPVADLRQRLLVRVVRVEVLPDHQWLLGCSLLSRLSEEKLHALLDASRREPEPVAGAEGVRVIVDVTFAEAGGAVGAFRARRLHVRDGWPVAPGTALTLGLNRGDADALQLRLRVLDCAQQAEGWVVCYEVLGRPSRAALYLLARRAL